MGGDDFHKGVKPASGTLDGSPLRILIIHTRWNSEIVQPLVAGAISSLKKYNVQDSNITVRDVPGAYELPGGALKLIRQSQQQSTNLVSNVMDDLPASPKGGAETGPFDAVICIGVLIKGSTMHFEYIADAVSHGIMKVGLDTGVPTVFGVLTCLTDEQAMSRAGIAKGEDKGHNHGLDWGSAAVEMALLKI